MVAHLSCHVTALIVHIEQPRRYSIVELDCRASVVKSHTPNDPHSSDPPHIQYVSHSFMSRVSEGEEVVFKSTTSTSITAPPELITRSDLHEIIEGWKVKFQKLTEGVRAIQIATQEVHAHMDNIMWDNCARDSEQNNRIKQIQEGLVRFIERCDPANPTPARSFATPCAPKMSTPITP